MTVHLIGLPHTPFDDQRASACAFTAKAVRMARMWRDAGHTVRVYWGGELADVSLLTDSEQVDYFGAFDPDVLPVIEWDASLPYWRTFHDRAAQALDDALVDRDLIAFVGGSVSRDLAARYAGRFTLAEPGIGYAGIMPDLAFGCYESYSWMHNRYAAFGIADGRPYDCVIPNAIFADEWHLGDDERYLLWVGRLIARKGPDIAAEIAEHYGMRLVMAGAGVASRKLGEIVATDGTVIRGDHVTHIGAVSGRDRAALYAGASAFIMPTRYLEPWGGVVLESMVSGVGVIASDWGAFPEQLPRQCRYRSLGQALDGLDYAIATRGESWRARALEIAGRDLCTRLYDEWFDRLYALRDGRNGWYAPRCTRS